MQVKDLIEEKQKLEKDNKILNDALSSAWKIYQEETKKWSLNNIKIENLDKLIKSYK